MVIDTLKTVHAGMDMMLGTGIYSKSAMDTMIKTASELPQLHEMLKAECISILTKDGGELNPRDMLMFKATLNTIDMCLETILNYKAETDLDRAWEEFQPELDEIDRKSK